MGIKLHEVKLLNGQSLQVRHMPRVLSWALSSAVRITIGQNLYISRSKKLTEIPMSILMHEIIHSQQQAAVGVLTFWWKYYTSREFRLSVESSAIANEIKFSASAIRRKHLINMYSHKLCSSQYFWAADDFNHAFEEIYRKCSSFDFI